MIGLLSIPTWIVHFSSILEWLFAMAMFYFIGKKINSYWFKMMPLFMIPHLMSGLCAIFYHVSEDTWDWLNQLQSYLTFVGSCSLAIWAYLLLRSETRKLGKKEGQRG